LYYKVHTCFHLKTLILKIRCLILHQDARLTSENIARVLKRSVRTIRDWTAKIDSGIDITKVNTGRGRKPSISKEEKVNIARTAKRSGSRTSTRKLGSQYKHSKSKVHSILKETGCEYNNKKAKPTLKPDVMEERVEYCKNMLKRRAKPINETFFSDEMGVDLYDLVKSKGWSGPRKKLKVELPTKNVKVNCYGAISRKGATSLHIYEKNLDAELYEEIVQEHQEEMEDLYPEGFKYQHDNLKLHLTAEPELISQGFDIIKYPRYSPDLSPIENLWHSVKARVADDNPKNKTQLVNSLHKNWEHLATVENLGPYFDTLHGRYSECIDLEGARLPH
jgi:transposase